MAGETFKHFPNLQLEGKDSFHGLIFVLFNGNCKHKFLGEISFVSQGSCSGIWNLGPQDLWLTDAVKSVVSGCESWNQHQVGHKKWRFYGKWFKKNAEYESFVVCMFYDSNSLFLIFFKKTFQCYGRETSWSNFSENNYVYRI